MKHSELVRRLEEAGCFVLRHGGNHDVWQSPITGIIFTVARHPSKEVPPGILRNILRKGGSKPCLSLLQVECDWF